MKKKIALAFMMIVILSLLFAGCAGGGTLSGEEAEPATAEDTTEVLTEDPYLNHTGLLVNLSAITNGGDFSADGNTVYYVSNGTLFAYDVTTEITTELRSEEHLSKVYAADGGVFYLTDNGGEAQKNLEFDLYELKADGSRRHIFSFASLPHDDEGALMDTVSDLPPWTVRANEQYVLVACHDMTYLIERNSGKTVWEDYNNFNTYAMDGGGRFYYTDPKDTLSVWQIDTDIGESVLCRGDGIGRREKTKDDTQIYEYVFDIDGDLFASKRVPSAVWKLNGNGEDVLVFSPEDDDRILDLLVLPGDGCVYIMYETISGTALNIYKLSKTDYAVLEHAVVPGAEIQGDRIVIVHDILIGKGSDTLILNEIFQ